MEGREVKILLSKANLFNTKNDYNALLGDLSDWKTEIVANNSAMQSSNEGQFNDTTCKSLSAYTNGEFSDLITEVELVDTTLGEAYIQTKTLLARCADFVEVLKGAEALTDDGYSSCDSGALDLLYFDDIWCPQESGYAGTIYSNTQSLMDERSNEETALNELQEILDTIESVTVNIGPYKSVVEECIIKQEYVDNLYDSLKQYGQGVEALNTYVYNNFINYDEVEVSLLKHNPSYEYPGYRTDDLEYIYQARLLKEGMTIDQINMATQDGTLTRKELADAYIDATPENREFVVDIIEGRTSEAFQMDPNDISDEALYVAYGIHAGKLKSDENGCVDQEFIDFNNEIIGANGDYINRMAEVSKRYKGSSDDSAYNNMIITANFYDYEAGLVPEGEHPGLVYKVDVLSYNGSTLLSGKLDSYYGDNMSSNPSAAITNAFTIGRDGVVISESMSAAEYSAMSDEERNEYIKDIYSKLSAAIPADVPTSGNSIIYLGPGMEIDFDYSASVKADTDNGAATIHLNQVKEDLEGVVKALDINIGDSTITVSDDSVQVKDGGSGATYGIDGEVAYVGSEGTVKTPSGEATVGITAGTNGMYSKSTVYTNVTDGTAEIDTSINIRVADTTLPEPAPVPEPADDRGWQPDPEDVAVAGVVVVGVIVVAAILLAPETGGASLGLLAFA